MLDPEQIGAREPGTGGALFAPVGVHDALFKHVFSVPEHAAAELASVLPREVSARIAWSTLRLEPGSFVDPDLAERHTDLLFSAELGGRRGYLYLLYEHQSEPHRWMPLRVVGYTVKILESARARSPDASLPVVLAVVLHHGRGGWSTARSMGELFDADAEMLAALGDRVLALRIEIDDLAASSAEAIAARDMPPLVRVVLGVLRDARTLPIDALIARWGALMIEAARAVGREALSVILRYLLEVQKIEDPKLLLAAARAHGGVELEEVAMSAFDRVRAEGKAEGKAEMFLRMLTLKFGAPSDAIVERVRGASVAELDRFADRILSAATVEEVLGEPLSPRSQVPR